MDYIHIGLLHIKLFKVPSDVFLCIQNVNEMQ